MAKTNTDTSDREIRVSRLLNAPVELVWEVWTEPEHITQWWGPDGFTNTIHLMDVKPNGEWNLTMHGPDGTDYKNKSHFTQIEKFRKLQYYHDSAPHFTATVTFESQGEQTMMHWHMLFNTREEFINTVRTFKADEGLRQNVEKLQRYLSANFQLQKQNKTNNMASVSTYLNFNGNTEEAFKFYKSVFGGEFSGKGLQRFEDIPASVEHPPLSDADKKLVLHVELTVLGGHKLMGTDAPESMGFTLNKGNNMHISLNTDTRAEADRLFKGLSEGGEVTMPLTDMFFGSYYGSFTDKFGINWMVNHVGQ